MLHDEAVRLIGLCAGQPRLADLSLPVRVSVAAMDLPAPEVAQLRHRDFCRP
jgi:hypothetical protein